MKEYVVSNWANVKSTITISYTCENCGKISSYVRPYWAQFSTTRRGYNLQKLEELATKDVNKQATDERNNIVSNKCTWEYCQSYPATYGSALNKGYEPCPNCGYLQSWMSSIDLEKRTRNFVTIPIYVITIILGWFLWKISDVPNPSVVNTGLLIALWVMLVFATRWFGRKLVNSTASNKEFGKVEKTNTPKLTWSDPVIT